MSFHSGVSGKDPAAKAFWYVMWQGNVSGSNQFCFFVGTQMSIWSYECQFRLHYVRGPIDTVGITCTYDRPGDKTWVWGQLPQQPRSYVPAENGWNVQFTLSLCRNCRSVSNWCSLNMQYTDNSCLFEITAQSDFIAHDVILTCSTSQNSINSIRELCRYGSNVQLCLVHTSKWVIPQK